VTQWIYSRRLAVGAFSAGYLQTLEVKKAMADASATESITLDRGNGTPWNTTERHGTKSGKVWENNTMEGS
jgi:hypothetical protein